MREREGRKEKELYKLLYVVEKSVNACSSQSVLGQAWQINNRRTEVSVYIH